MPFIRGRYHINPVMGQAIEAARQAEAALAEIEARARQNRSSNPCADSGDDSYGDDATGFRPAQSAAKGPVHRVEIEAAEVVPNHSGRAQRGFVARIHHAPATPDAAPGSASGSASDTDDWRDASSSASNPPAPETYVFADHGDLVDFLRDALASETDR
jgi:hypothetical protein